MNIHTCASLKLNLLSQHANYPVFEQNHVEPLLLPRLSRARDSGAVNTLSLARVLAFALPSLTSLNFAVQTLQFRLDTQFCLQTCLLSVGFGLNIRLGTTLLSLENNSVAVHRNRSTKPCRCSPPVHPPATGNLLRLKNL
jgi:hypothetical protein